MPLHASSAPADETVGPFQFVILVMSVLALAAIAVDTVLVLPVEISRILQGVDLVACLAFLVDFVLRFHAAPSKLAFMKFGWIDLLASIPNIDVFRLGRFFRVFRLLRLLRGIQSLRRFFHVMYRSRRRGGAATVILATFLLVVFSSVAILLCEQGEGTNIKSASDAVWWTVTTITTVGYGDRYPVTAAGRMLAIGLMFAGVGLFGALSGIIASLFLGRSESADQAVLKELRALRAEVEGRRDGKPANEPRLPYP